MTPPGIEPATFRLVARCATACPGGFCKHLNERGLRPKERRSRLLRGWSLQSCTFTNIKVQLKLYIFLTRWLSVLWSCAVYFTVTGQYLYFKINLYLEIDLAWCSYQYNYKGTL